MPYQTNHYPNKLGQPTSSPHGPIKKAQCPKFFLQFHEDLLDDLD